MTDEKKSTIDWFLADLLQAEVTITDDLMEKLIEHAQAFLTMNGVMTWERYAMLGVASRAAFVEAGQRLGIARALEK